MILISVKGGFGSVPSPLCVRELERVCSQTQLCQLRCLMTILDNYNFQCIVRPDLFTTLLTHISVPQARDCASKVISGLPATRPQGRRGTRLFTQTSISTPSCRARHRIEHSSSLLRNPDVEISPSRARTLYSRNLSSLKDNLKMARRGRNM